MNRNNFVRMIQDEKRLPTRDEIQTAYDEFMNFYLKDATGACSIQSFDEMLYYRELLFIYTDRKYSFLRSKKNRLFRSCVRKALALLSARIRTVELMMQYPGQASLQLQDTVALPSLRWNMKLGKRALMEVLAALECLGAFLGEDGKPASFASIVSLFEKMLHIELSRPYKTRTEVLERKIRCANFLDRMRNALIEKREKLNG